ncbi:hypothetical protein RBH29_08610 [Herbivorax sp. ANBcel31]|uniref:hypothetical protein n=1 Tax=Herbivorax sp. ANBcel31 TaxID=3069754 RepID=UPI0027B126DB|nr:hypothetical protein [Herbivorax sp. ANBcel31]MDQ2086487.1 hypothetical protein [Herbivorax sp. ANBcel31]
MGYKYRDEKPVQLEATTEEQYIEVSYVKISSIINFSEANKILLSINKPFAEAGNNYKVLLLGLQGSYNYNEEVSARRIYYKTLGGTAEFEISGFGNTGAII